MPRGQNKISSWTDPLSLQLIFSWSPSCFSYVSSDISPRLNCASAWPCPPAFSNHRAASCSLFKILRHSSWSCHFMSKWYCWWKKSCTQLIGSVSHYLQPFIHPRSGGWMYDFWTINNTTSRNNAQGFFQEIFFTSPKIAVLTFAGGTRFDGGKPQTSVGPVLLLDFDSKAISKHCAQALGTHQHSVGCLGI